MSTSSGKCETDLAELVRSRDVKLTRHGKDLIGYARSHDDHEPSLVVTPSKNPCQDPVSGIQF